MFLIIATSLGGQTKYQKDFSEYWKIVHQNFAYFDTQKIDWNAAREIYEPIVDTIKSNKDFIRLLEKVNHELHNGHVSLTVNLPSSSLLIPSGTDIWVSYQNESYIVEAVKENSNAEKAGIKRGMKVTGYNHKLIKKALMDFLPKSVSSYNQQMHEYAVNSLLAGTHDSQRTINVNDSLTFTLENIDISNSTKLLEKKIFENKIGYIRFDNSLGDNQTIVAFDKALSSLKETMGLILDLRDTPSGGNSTVARAILSRFITKEVPYQKHTFPYEQNQYGIKRTSLELVTPRKPNYYKPLVILCGPWTGSMGEGIVIGFDGLNRAKIVGSKMAGLLGAIYEYKLSQTGIGFQIPTEKLFHVGGYPREDFIPTYYSSEPKEQLQKAINLIKEGI